MKKEERKNKQKVKKEEINIKKNDIMIDYKSLLIIFQINLRYSHEKSIELNKYFLL
jgi:hypothetical protein